MNPTLQDKTQKFILEQIALAKDLGQNPTKYLLAQQLLLNNPPNFSNNDISQIQSFFNIKPKKQPKSLPTPQSPEFQHKSSKNSTKQPTFSTALNFDEDPPQKSLKDQLHSLSSDIHPEPTQNKPKSDPKPDSTDTSSLQKTINQLLTDNIIIPTAHLSLQSISGMHSTKTLLQTSILLPLLHPALFASTNPFRRIFMHSLPGCGKSFITKCIAGEAKIPLISVTASMIFSKWQGASEKTLSAIFELARQQGRCILFLDEIDSISTSRTENDSESARRVKNELLMQLDRADDSQIIVVAATNLPFQVDNAVRRRFEKRVFIDLPDQEARFEFLRGEMVKREVFDQGVCDECVEKTQGYSMSDMQNIVKESQNLPLQRLIKCQYFVKVGEKYVICEEGAVGSVKMSILDGGDAQFEEVKGSSSDFLEAVGKVRSSISLDDIKEHLRFQKEFGSD